MIVSEDDLDNYVGIIWSEHNRIHKLLYLMRITPEGAVRKCQSYNKRYMLFTDVDAAVTYIKRFYIMQPVIEVIKEIIEVDYFLPIPENFDRNTVLNDVGLDSLESINMLYSIERIYKINFGNEFLPKTVGDLIDKIEELRAK